jgi:hypothetical protein
MDGVFAGTRSEADIERITEGKPNDNIRQAIFLISAQWMLENDSSKEESIRKRWRLAYNTMTKLASNCEELPQQLSVDWVGFTEDDLMARGAFAVVYKGIDRDRRSVAVKRLHLGESNDRDSVDLHRVCLYIISCLNICDKH